MNALTKTKLAPCSDCTTIKTCSAQQTCRDRGRNAQACAVIGCGKRPAKYWHPQAKAYYCQPCADQADAAAGKRVCMIDTAGILGSPQPSNPPALTELVLGLAKAIEGPPGDQQGRMTESHLDWLRDAHWSKITAAARGLRIYQARSVLHFLGVGSGGETHTGTAAALGWIKAIAAAQAVVVQTPEGPDRAGAERVLSAIYRASGEYGLFFRRPAYLAPEDPRQGNLGIPE